MSRRSYILGSLISVALLYGTPLIAVAEETPATQATQSFQDQIKTAMDQLAKANEARDNAIKVFSDQSTLIKETPQQIEAFIESLRSLNSTFDAGSKFRSALDDMEANVDLQISQVLDDPDPRLQAAVETLKGKRDRIVSLRKDAQELVEIGKILVRKLEENRRVAEKLIAIESLDTVLSVAQEALAQYRDALTEFNKVVERSNSYFVTPES